MSRAALLSQSQPNGDVISAHVSASNGQSEVLKVAGESNPFLSRQAPVLQQLIVTKKLEPWKMTDCYKKKQQFQENNNVEQPVNHFLVGNVNCSTSYCSSIKKTNLIISISI